MGADLREERIAALEHEAQAPRTLSPFRLREICSELARIARRPDPRIIEVLVTTVPIVHDFNHRGAFSACALEPCATVHDLVRQGIEAALQAQGAGA